jgi:hypothetical protein
MRNFLRARKPVLNINQLARLSNIFDNAGQVIFGVAVLSPLISLDNFSPLTLILGLTGVLLCWIISLILIRKKKRL